MKGDTPVCAVGPLEKEEEDVVSQDAGVGNIFAAHKSRSATGAAARRALLRTGSSGARVLATFLVRARATVLGLFSRRENALLSRENSDKDGNPVT